MVMNTQQLFYLTEIQRTRSISQAAENLYMSQPNLSRVLRETEEAMGFPIFQRTRRGVQPTEKGKIFLQHAKNILREAEFMENLGSSRSQTNRFRVCLPRSWHFVELTRNYLAAQTPGGSLDAVIRECHPRQALEYLRCGDVEIAVIRYGVEYQAYFSEQAQAGGLKLVPLSQVEYRVLLQRESVLASCPSLDTGMLEGYTEVLHRDVFPPIRKGVRGIYAVDRLAQIQLLQKLPRCFAWMEPLPDDLLTREALVQKPCQQGGPRYQNALVYKPQCAMSRLEAGFLDWISQAEKI